MRISKALEGAIAQALFASAHTQRGLSLKDGLMLQIISVEGSLAYRLLAEQMEEAKLYHLRLRFARAASEVERGDVSAEEFYRDYTLQLSMRFGDMVRISTIHAMIDILGDNTTLSAKIFPQYGITIELLTERLRFLSGEDEMGRELQRADNLPDILQGGTPQRDSLAQFGVDLTELARGGGVDVVVGREREIDRVVQILARRKKNSPVLVGEAGVGKSAIVEGLARRIVEGRVPHTIADKRIFALDVALLVAGTKYRGEFEERLHKVLDELRSRGDTILFIDEIHTIVGAGATQGSLDTANILKPALARGEIQTIGATTFDEYRESIEQDAALERRFQRVVVEETSPEATLDILRNIASVYEQHHSVHYTEEALRACVELADRFISGRNFPDKAIDLLDEAGAVAHLMREGAYCEVGAGEVARCVAMATGVPAEQLSANMAKRLQGLQRYLQSRVVGQDEVVERLSRSVCRAHVGLRDTRRPMGVFLFIGATGVGKTMLAKELATYLFGSADNLVRIDMSEYSEAHNVARLIGSPPGYIGYGEGGQLTEAIRRKPYSVLLLDEIEKAHPTIFNTLLQLFDDGRLTDGGGRTVDFRNTIVVMTSNVGSREVGMRNRLGYATFEEQNRVAEYRRAAEKSFAPEFLNRVDEILLFSNLSEREAEQIVRKEITLLRKRLKALGYRLTVSRAVLREVVRLGFSRVYGARSLRRVVVERIEEAIAHAIISLEIPVDKVFRVGLKEGNIVICGSPKCQKAG